MPRPRRIRSIAVALVAWALLVAAPPAAQAYPDAEVVWEAGGGPPFSFGFTSSVSGFILTSDVRLLASYGENVKVVDMGRWALEPEQPPALSSDSDNQGVINAIDYNGANDRIVAAQETGNLLQYLFSDITADPLLTEVVEDDSLGPLVHDHDSGYVYVSDNTSYKIYAVDMVDGSIVATISPIIPKQAAFKFTDALYLDETDEIYFATDSGAVFYIPSGGSAATRIDVGEGEGDEISAIAAVPNGTEIYAADKDRNSVERISTTSHSVTGDEISISPNASPTDIVVTEVRNPTAVYAYVAGAGGLSVINTATQQVLDFGDDSGVDGEPMVLSAEPFLLQASSLTDGIVYVNFITGGVGVVTDRPVAAITGIEYSGGGESMGRGQGVDVSFMADADSTYEMRIGGGVEASGQLLVDSSGQSSGALEADVVKTATISYDDNADLFDEGENEFWVFVTADGLRGRRAAGIMVDTPPPDVVAVSTGFGSGRVYVNFNRVDVSDMASYNIYCDTDPDAVMTKTEVSAKVNQPSGGSTVTGEVGGLANGTLYYVALEAVDQAGNISENRTNTFSDGTRISASPERTVGPAGLSGEKGCGLAPGESPSAAPAVALLLAALLAAAAARRRAWLAVWPLVLVALFSLWPLEAAAQPGAPSIQESEAHSGIAALEERSNNAWELEVKTGFWMPASANLDKYFDSCCNLITRVEGGYLFDKRYGVELGAGFLYKSGRARGEDSGEVSQDKFSFMLFPFEASFAFRADYFTWRYLIPYAKAGFDGVLYRESVAGDSTTGMKWGCHALGGVQLNISELASRWGDAADWTGEFFMNFEVEYQWINNFGAGGLDLSGPVYSVGLLFYF